MFSKSITNSSQFLMMPQSSQNLYFHLGMNADDDGFCEHFSIMRMTDSKPDDLKVLQAKNFVSVFDDKVLVITQWKENNYIQKDRYSQSKYLAIYKKELKLLAKNQPVMYTECIHNGSKLVTQVRLGKDRLEKDTNTTVSGETDMKSNHKEISEIIDAFKVINPTYNKWFARKPMRDACERLFKTHGLEQVLKVINFLLVTNAKEFYPNIQTPIQLEDKWSSLETAVKKDFNKIKKLRENVIL